MQRIRTWLRSAPDVAVPAVATALRQVIDDSAALARLEGLHGHAAAAEARRKALPPA
jgi:histidinol dehydrogenase